SSPVSNLVPYTTLFRSRMETAIHHERRDRYRRGGMRRGAERHPAQRRRHAGAAPAARLGGVRRRRSCVGPLEPTTPPCYGVRSRSEEHTSELQSRVDLV